MKDPPLILYCAAAGLTVKHESHTPQPKVISFQPKMVTNLPFPATSVNYAFARPQAFKSEKLITETHFFNFPNRNGRQIFGVSCVFDIQLPSDVQDKLGYQTATFAEHALYMLLAEPIGTSFVDFLVYFSEKVQMGDIPLDAAPDTLFNHFVTTRRPPLVVSYGEAALSLTQRIDQREIKVIPLSCYGSNAFKQSGSVFKKIPPDVIIDVLEALLQEKTVVLTSANQQLNSQLVYEFLGLLYPLSYPYPFYATLPKAHMSLLHAPIPIMAACHIDVLKHEVMPPSAFILDIQSGQLLGPQDLFNIKATSRFVIPRSILGQIGINLKVVLQDPNQPFLQNTLNYQATDSNVKPSNVEAVTRREVIEKKLFKKSKVLLVEDRVDKAFQEDSSSQCSQLIDSHCLQMIAYSDFSGSFIKFAAHVNERLFIVAAGLELSFRQSSMKRQKSDLISQQQDPLGILHQLRSNYFKPIDYLHLPKTAFEAEQPAPQYVNVKPALPYCIRKVMLKVLLQNSCACKRQESLSDTKSTSQMALAELQNDDEIFPNPLAMLLDSQIQITEQAQFGNQQDNAEQLTKDVLSAITEDFYPVGAKPAKITQFQKTKTFNYVKNTTEDLQPKPGKVIDVARIRVGLCSALLAMVAHYRSSLRIGYDARDAEPISRQTYEIYALSREERDELHAEMQREHDFNLLQKEILKSVQVIAPSKDRLYSELFDFESFVAETPEQFRPFVSHLTRTAFFSAFLESRLLQQAQIEGVAFPSLGQGWFYAARAAEVPSSQVFGSSMQPVSMNTYTTGFRFSVDQSTSSNSRPDSPIRFVLERSVVQANLSYERAKDDDLCDALLKHYQQVSPDDQQLIQAQNTFLVLKETGQENNWGPRILQVTHKQHLIDVSWLDGQTVRATLIVSYQQLADCVTVPSHRTYPTAFPVQVQGRVGIQGRDELRALTFCFQNDHERRLFLLHLRAPTQFAKRERIAKGIGAELLANGRKARRYAAGVLEENLQQSGGDCLQWIFSNVGAK